MATISDEVRLAIKLEAEKAIKTLNKATGSAGEFRQALDGSAQSGNNLSAGLKKLKIAAMAAAASFAALKVLKSSFAAANQAAKELRLLEMTLISTGNAARLTAKQYIAMAQDMERTTNISVGAATAGITRLLEFTSIMPENFDRAFALTADYAERYMSGNMVGAAEALGRALEDPIHGMSILQKQGFKLSEDQKRMAQRFVETGRAAEAQALILDTVSESIAGTAMAMRENSAQLQNTISATFTAIGEGFADPVNKGLKDINDSLVENEKNFKQFGKSLGDLFEDITSRVKTAVAPLLIVFNAIVQAVKIVIDTISLLFNTFIDIHLRVFRNFVNSVIMILGGLTKIPIPGVDSSKLIETVDTLKVVNDEITAMINKNGSNTIDELNRLGDSFSKIINFTANAETAALAAVEEQAKGTTDTVTAAASKISSAFEAAKRKYPDSMTLETMALQVKLTDNPFKQLEYEYQKAMRDAINKGETFFNENAKYITKVYYKQVADLTEKTAKELAFLNRELAAETAENAIALADLEFDRQIENLKKYKDMQIDVSDTVVLLEKKHQKELADAKLEMWEKLKNAADEYFDNLRKRIAAMALAGGTSAKAGAAVKDAGIEAARETQIGQAAGSFLQGGGPAAIISVVGQLATSFFTMITSIDSVNKVLNVFSTIMEGVRSVIEPVLDSVLKPLINVFTVIGEVLGSLVTPLIEELGLMLRPVIDLITPILKIIQQFTPLLNSMTTLLRGVQIPLQVLGSAVRTVADALVWFYNSAVYPVGNGLISVVNGVIKAINKVLGVFGVKIKEIQKLEKIDMSDLQTLADKIAAELAKVDEEIALVKEIYSEQRKTVQDLFSSNIQTLKDLKRVGAITRADYERQVAQAQKEYNDKISAINAEEKAKLAALESIRQMLEKGILVYSVNATEAAAEVSSGGGKTTADSIIDVLKKTTAVGIATSAAVNAGKTVINAVSSTISSVGKTISKMFSDERLKSNISAVGSTVGGLPIYKYNYSDYAQKRFGLPAGEQVGVMAQEVRKAFPDAVSTKDGYLQVDYAKLAKHRASSGGKTFSDTRLKTNISRLSPSALASGGGTVIHISVGGSVVSEGQLVDTITRAMEQNRRRGRTPQGMI